MSWRDPRVPMAEECVLGPLLERWAAVTPDKIFAMFETGESWTYADTLELVRRTAAGLQALGVGQGDFVNVWMPAGPDTIRVWFAINWLGAVYVPINLAYKGRLLEHVIANAQARLIIVDAELLPRLTAIDRAALTDAVVFGPEGDAIDGLSLHAGTDLLRSIGVDRGRVEVWDTHQVIYTSGTTGPSKGVLNSPLQGYASIEHGWTHLGADDRFLVASPLFHISGAGVVRIALQKGASFALVSTLR